MNCHQKDDDIFFLSLSLSQSKKKVFTKDSHLVWLTHTFDDFERKKKMKEKKREVFISHKSVEPVSFFFPDTLIHMEIGKKKIFPFPSTPFLSPPPQKKKIFQFQKCTFFKEACRAVLMGGKILICLLQETIFIFLLFFSKLQGAKRDRQKGSIFV